MRSTLSARPSTCPRFRPEKKEKRGPLSTISVSSAWRLPEVQTLRKEKCDPLSTISASSAWHLPEVQTRRKEKCDPLSTISAEHLAEVQARKKEKCDPLSAISVSSAWHLPEVQIEKKGAIHCPQFLSARPSTCPRFRPEKRKRSAIHNFCQLGQAPARGSDARCKVQGARCKGKGRDKKERTTTPLRIQWAKRSNYFNSVYSLKHIS